MRHVDALSRHVQAVHTSKIIPKERVKAEQDSDKFCNSIEVGKFMGKSEYFYDEEGVIFRRRMNGEHQLLVPKTLAKEVIELLTTQFMRHTQGKRGPWKFCAYVIIGPR
jgi:hypothetical protein